MPIYEYTCLDCKAAFELIRPIKDADARTTCAHCGSEQIQRNLSLFNAHSGGRTVTGSTNCSHCSGGSCSTCGLSI